MSLARDMAKAGERVEALYLEHRGRVAGEALTVAHAFAPVGETGELKAGIVPFSGSPPDAPGEGRYGETEGAPATAADRARAVELSKAAGVKGTFGVAATADHSSFQEARQPFMTPAVDVAERIGPLRGSDGDL